MENQIKKISRKRGLRRTLAWILSLSMVLMFLPVMTALAVTGNVAGFVTDDATSDPIEYAIVKLFDSNHIEIDDTITDDTGEFIFQDVPEGTGYYVTAFAFGYIPADSADFEIDSTGTFNGDADVALLAQTVTKKISGVIGDGTNPIVGAKVELLYMGVETEEEIDSVALGEYEFPAVPEGEGYSLRVSKFGFNTQTTAEFEVDDDIVMNISLTALPTFDISGSITVDGTSDAIAWATVKLYFEDTLVDGFDVQATWYGNYTIFNVPAGNYKIEASAFGYITKQTATFSVAANVTGQNLALVALDRFSVSGTVKDDSAAPIEGARVILLDANDVLQYNYQADTNEDGDYTILGVPVGTGYKVKAFAFDYIADESTSFNVAAINVTGVDITLLDHDGTEVSISGMITDWDTSDPVEGAIVRLGYMNIWLGNLFYAVTEEDGTYEIEDVPIGEGYYIEVYKNGYEISYTPYFNVVSGGTTINLAIAATPPSGGGGSFPPSVTDVPPINDATDFVKGLFQFILGRDFDQAGLDYWVNELLSGNVPGRRIGVEFVSSDEFKGLMASLSAEDLVTTLYRGLLGRDPDPEGFAYWVSEINRGVSLAGIARTFAEIGEFRALLASIGIAW